MKEQNRTIIKPDYYDDFVCIAGDCPYTCCREWKIAVDEDTYERWQRISLPASFHLPGCLAKQTKELEEGRVIALTEDGECPYLNKKGLCDLVMQYGDTVLSSTCATFPRQVHTFEDRMEYSLVACCPEIIDIWHRRGNIKFSGMPKDGEQIFQIRLLMIEQMKDMQYTVSEHLMMLYYILLDIYSKEDPWTQDLADYTNLETIQELADTIQSMSFNLTDSLQERNELFLDLVENYRKEGLYEDFLHRTVTQAENCEKQPELMEEKWDAFREKMKPYASILRNYVINEFFTNTIVRDVAEDYTKEDQLDTMVMMLQWIAMEYAVIVHGIFLLYLKQGEICYEMVREVIVIIARMTGYDEEDIYEYLENSFEEPVWDWGYLALIIHE